MSFFNDEQLAAGAKAKASYRLIGVTTKLSSQEVEDIERLARKHGLQRGEFIRQLILDELARDSGDPPVSPELVEIIGLRLMLTNLLKPLTTGQKITPEVFDGIIAEVKKHKRGLAIKTRTDLEKA
jgi:Ribbon-helix-helix protein, copG family